MIHPATDYKTDAYQAVKGAMIAWDACGVQFLHHVSEYRRLQIPELLHKEKQWVKETYQRFQNGDRQPITQQSRCENINTQLLIQSASESLQKVLSEFHSTAPHPVNAPEEWAREYPLQQVTRDLHDKYESLVTASQTWMDYAHLVQASVNTLGVSPTDEASAALPARLQSLCELLKEGDKLEKCVTVAETQLAALAELLILGDISDDLDDGVTSLLMIDSVGLRDQMLRFKEAKYSLFCQGCPEF